MIERDRANIGPVGAFLKWVSGDQRIDVDPLDAELVELTTRVGWRGKMHDRQIVCHTLKLAQGGDTVHLLTADAEIRACGLVSIVW